MGKFESELQNFGLCFGLTMTLELTSFLRISVVIWCGSPCGHYDKGKTFPHLIENILPTPERMLNTKTANLSEERKVTSYN